MGYKLLYAIPGTAANNAARRGVYRIQTQTSVWVRPEEVPESALESLPGSDYLRSSGNGTSASQSQADGPSSVRASHLLIKHRDSRRPASWKEVCPDLLLVVSYALQAQLGNTQNQDPITRTKEEALEKLKTFHDQLSQAPASDLPAQFAQLANTESDCSSHSKGGDLGAFKRGQMQKPFEDTSFGLPVGAMSGLIETDSGVHLILRTA